MKLNSIKIDGLFGMFNYNLKFGEDSHYMILTSPNGYGKTTILNIVNALAKLLRLRVLPQIKLSSCPT